ncbi:hypothetical protein [Streptomyces sp. NPDC054834]
MRIASGALCAAVLVGITGPAAMAADPALERSHAASPDTPLPGADALVAKLRSLNSFGAEATAVTDLVDAALQADNGRLSAAEARKLGDAAKRALAKAAAKAATRGALPALTRGTVAPGAAERRAADPTSDALDALEEAIDNLVQAAVSGDIDQVYPSATELLTDAIKLLTATLVDNALPAPTEIPSTSVSEVPAVTLPAISLPTTVVPQAW